MKFIFLTLLLIFSQEVNKLTEENLIKAIGYTNQENNIKKIANELQEIKDNFKTHKNYNNRFEVAKRIKLLAYSMEVEYLKAKPLIDAHYSYLKSKNSYGLANAECRGASGLISGSKTYKSPIFKLIEKIKINSDLIIKNTEGNNWAMSFFNLQSNQKELFEKNSSLQQLLKKTLKLQRIDATKTISERRKIYDRKAIEDQNKFNKRKYD